MMPRRRLVGALMGVPMLLRTGLAVSATRARVGLSLPLTGVQATVADELLRGYQLAFRAAHAQGVEVDTVVEDDQSAADKTATAIRRFGADNSILASTGIVGTPHAKASIPVARAAGLPVVGLRSGAGELRDGGQMVYHLRASYELEIERMISMLGEAGSRIAVLASDDTFGRPAAEYVQKTAARRGIGIAKVVYADRNGGNVQKAVADAIEPSQRPSALLVLMITRPAIAAVQAARARQFMAPVFTMSFTAGVELTAAGPQALRGLGLVSAFPVPRSAHDDVSDGFRKAATAAGQSGLVESVTAAEGWWYGSALVRAIAKCGDRPTRQGLVEALETRHGLRLGDDVIAFDAQRVGRRYLQVVYFDGAGMLRA